MSSSEQRRERAPPSGSSWLRVPAGSVTVDHNLIDVHGDVEEERDAAQLSKQRRVSSTRARTTRLAVDSPALDREIRPGPRHRLDGVTARRGRIDLGVRAAGRSVTVTTTPSFRSSSGEDTAVVLAWATLTNRGDGAASVVRTGVGDRPSSATTSLGPQRQVVLPDDRVTPGERGSDPGHRERRGTSRSFSA
jgi:hypothetical protein